MGKTEKKLNVKECSECMDYSNDIENESQSSRSVLLSDDAIDELTKPKTKRICLPPPKPKSRVFRERRKDKRSHFEMKCIGSGWSKQNMDSAGHKFDGEWFARNEYRQLLTRALTKDDIPLGSQNRFALAVRIESRLFRLLSDNAREYRKHCNEIADYLNNEENRDVRDKLLLGQIEPNQFVFIPIKDDGKKDMIVSKIKLREKERIDKMKMLKSLNGL